MKIKPLMQQGKIRITFTFAEACVLHKLLDSEELPYVNDLASLVVRKIVDRLSRTIDPDEYALRKARTAEIYDVLHMYGEAKRLVESVGMTVIENWDAKRPECEEVEEPFSEAKEAQQPTVSHSRKKGQKDEG